MQRTAGVSHRDGPVEASDDYQSPSGTTPDQHKANGKSSLQQNAMGFHLMNIMRVMAALGSSKLSFTVVFRVERGVPALDFNSG